MNYFQAMCTAGAEEIKGRIVFSDGNAIGLLKPSTLWGNDQIGTPYICGPLGIIKISKEGPEYFWQALIAADAILFGDSKEITSCQTLLEDKKTSRTSSFLMTTSKNCADFLLRVEKIRSARVLIIGCGGIGSLTAMNLAGAGVGYLHLIDGDTIESSNFNRQFFWTPDDVGRKKVDVLQREIKVRYPEVNCQASATFIAEETLEELTKSFDIIIVTADEPLGLGTSLDSHQRALVIGGGYIHQHISFGVNESKLIGAEKIQWQRNPFFVGPSFGPTNTELAGITSSFAVQFLAKEDRGNLDIAFGCIWNASEFPRKIISKTNHHEP